jgi:hypothetical protein
VKRFLDLSIGDSRQVWRYLVSPTRSGGIIGGIPSQELVPIVELFHPHILYDVN